MDEMYGYVIPLPFCPIFFNTYGYENEITFKGFRGLIKKIMRKEWGTSSWDDYETFKTLGKLKTPIEWNGTPDDIASIYFGRLVKAKYWHGEDKTEFVYDPYVCESYTMTAPSICLTFENGDTDVYSIADWNNRKITAIY